MILKPQIRRDRRKAISGFRPPAKRLEQCRDAEVFLDLFLGFRDAEEGHQRGAAIAEEFHGGASPHHLPTCPLWPSPTGLRIPQQNCTNPRSLASLNARRKSRYTSHIQSRSAPSSDLTGTIPILRTSFAVLTKPAQFIWFF